MIQMERFVGGERTNSVLPISPPHCDALLRCAALCCAVLRCRSCTSAACRWGSSPGASPTRSPPAPLPSPAPRWSLAGVSCCCWGGPWNHNASQPTCLSAHCSTTAAVASIAAVCHRCLPALLCLVLSADGPDSVRLLDEQTFEVLDRLQLQPHELACSLCRRVPLLLLLPLLLLFVQCTANHPLLVCN